MKTLFFLFVITMTSCLISPEPKYPACYGIEFNPTRKALGIPLLKEDWEPTYSSKTMIRWKPDDNEKNKPYYSSKSISFYKGTLASEIDTYYSNHKYQTEDGTSYDYLTIQFYYIYSKYNENKSIDIIGDEEVGFVYLYSHLHKNSLFTVKDRITKSQADSILISWGLGDEVVSLSTEKTENVDKDDNN